MGMGMDNDSPMVVGIGGALPQIPWEYGQLLTTTIEQESADWS